MLKYSIPTSNVWLAKVRSLVGRLLFQSKVFFLRNSWRRYRNLAEIKLHTMTGRWKPLHLRSDIMNGIFTILVDQSDSTKRVIKIPRASNDCSAHLIRSLKSEEAFNAYKSALLLPSTDSLLKWHTAEVYEIRRDGGYISEYIEGVNLAEILVDHLKGRAEHQYDPADIIGAIENLITDMEEYVKQHGHLIGDWPLHNLIYSQERKCIFNVDSEGFFTCAQPSPHNDLRYNIPTLKDLIQLIDLRRSTSELDAQILHVVRALNAVKESDKSYSGSPFLIGYHSLELNGKYFSGQRGCSARLAKVPFDFTGKVVLDLGCNCGGMLQALSSKITRGYGFDVDSKCINAANVIKRINNTNNLNFFTFDLDEDDLGILDALVLGDKIDVCFLLSICMWLKNPERIIQHASEMAEHLLFESNGTEQMQEHQLSIVRSYFSYVELISLKSDDDLFQEHRRLYWCLHRATDASPPQG